MNITTSINLDLLEKFKSKSFFHKFYLFRVADEISSKIRTLREKRDLTQKEFALQADMKQSAISRLEQSDYGGWNFKTLARIAEVLDARLIVDFVLREDVIKQFEMEQKSKILKEHTSVFDALKETLGEPNRNIEPSRMATKSNSANGPDLPAGSLFGDSKSVPVHRLPGYGGDAYGEVRNAETGQV